MYFPDKELSSVIDYFRMTFKRHDIDTFFEEVMQMNIDAMLREPSGKYGYVEKFELDQIRVYLSAPGDERGIMIELGGQGCRQFESVLEAQKRSWEVFLRKARSERGKATRVDIAVDDLKGYIDIPDCLYFTQAGYVSSRIDEYNFNGTGQIGTENIQGVSIYFGSKQSNIYFTMYQKNYEQAKKNKVSAEEYGVWNRYEIRLADEKAEEAVTEILRQNNIGEIGRGILKGYLNFYFDEDLKVGKRKLKRLVKGWNLLLDDVAPLKLSLKPSDSFYLKTENWLKRQAGGVMKMVTLADGTLGKESTIDEIVSTAELTQRQMHMLKTWVGTVQDFVF
ncbi:TPA: replication initiation factor domain-containing protein [Listeria monocytogenes]|uniref:replication initiation factor domain-containing protein n=1 Tax=Listeria monocytogenes TaxID=1639 RepID=UPI000D1DA455|nr:replication initiation factor domain-containing protein [Listeria monocytogenes]AVV06797.1 DNA relaxase NicK [Listeria monocytogenes]EAF6833204.1 replication initiation factor domain-containing protein [Listeria monocytogenes]ECC1351407.1 replication initiation factor domain-containing protein [Listeria monocytogenes]ECC1363039.1 replication initiation factor domain-containing protein [Listeria monocytogenes]ECC1458409.1 replication initiation factor domain-containing protein [Listeria mono